MIKDKRIRNILLYLVVILACVFFIGFSTAKNVYASTLNDIYTIEEIYDMYDVPEENRINPWDYGYSRLVILGYRHKVSGSCLEFICHNDAIDFSNIYNDKYNDWIVNYDFNEPVKLIRYANGEIDGIYDVTTVCLGREPFYEKVYENEYYHWYKIVYSSYNLYKPDGTVFFWATPPTTLFPIMAEMKNQNQLRPLSQVVYLVPISLGLVVFLLAFRKVWRVLKTISYQA